MRVKPCACGDQIDDFRAITETRAEAGKDGYGHTDRSRLWVRCRCPPGNKRRPVAAFRDFQPLAPDRAFIRIIDRQCGAKTPDLDTDMRIGDGIEIVAKAHDIDGDPRLRHGVIGVFCDELAQVDQQRLESLRCLELGVTHNMRSRPEHTGLIPAGLDRCRRRHRLFPSSP